ncbi:transmembrane protein 6/97 [Dunaliella salina]|uniref:Transmembrane protein 6/97 n=1 Tax=Dunaliella salina TaxID=3046 RepID=A0ABQ7G2H1_DUNSA|nr:transmembrane protein 6/97 [Dunaliella salina]|eukprot:KAF5828798.1 transmembrane protein 6/97 [Dunaliella salina]
MARRSAFEHVFIIWFVLHIPITLLVDAQSLLPSSWFPPFAKQLVRWHVETNSDWLVGTNPLWFKSLIGAELLFQLPCFVLLAMGLVKRKRWTRTLSIVYGIHAATTFIPITGEILFGRPMTPESIKLAAIYLPYLVMPAILAVRMALYPYPDQSPLWQSTKDTVSKAFPRNTRPPSLLRRPFDLVYVLYFFSHVPITMLFDSQSIVPREAFPTWATDAMDWHARVNSDHLVQANPTWFVALVVCECLLQLPTFLVFVYAFMYQRSWVRIPAIVYGSHVTTTLVPILTEFLFHESAPKVMAALVYSPWLLLPLILTIRMAARPYPDNLQAKLQSKMI